jgi:phosphoglycolate phosphatase-like HAD superfamily hydrolase
MLPMFDYDLYIFDCDGVILDANQIKIDAMEQAIIDAGFSGASVLKCKSHFANNFGQSRFVHIRHFVEHILDIKESRQEGAYQLILEQFSERCRKGYIYANITPNFDAMLNSLKGAKAVASGSEQDELRLLLNKLGYQNKFERIYGSPTAKTVNVAAILKEIPHTKAVMIGDAIADYEAAKYNSIDFIAYLPFSNVRNTMKELAAEHKFSVLNEWPFDGKRI